MLLNRSSEYLATRLLVHAGASDRLAVGEPNEMPAQSFIDASVTIVGDLRSEGDVQLDGHICGNVQCAQLIVGRHAAITGAVTAEQLVVRGRITGTIRARFVILQHTARVESDIAYNLLAMDEGATFEGAARHRSNPLQDADAVSSFAELQEMMTNAEAGRAGCSEGNGQPDTPETEHRPSGPNGSPGSSDHRRTEEELCLRDRARTTSE